MKLHIAAHRIPLILGGALALLVGCVANPDSVGGVIWVSSGPPARVHEEPPPPPDETYIWIAGYYTWGGAAYTWVPGHYERRPERGAKWHEGKWHHERRGWRYEEGHWDHGNRHGRGRGDGDER